KGSRQARTRLIPRQWSSLGLLLRLRLGRVQRTTVHRATLLGLAAGKKRMHGGASGVIPFVAARRRNAAVIHQAAVTVVETDLSGSLGGEALRLATAFVDEEFRSANAFGCRPH